MTKQSYILAGLIWLLSSGGYMAMPLFPVLTEIHALSIVQTGSLTAVYIFTQMAVPLFSGPAGDQYGYKKMAVTGECIRGAGFICMGLLETYPLLLMSAAAAGLGGGTAVPSLQVLMMKSGDSCKRPELSSLRASAATAGILSGPLLAGLFISYGHLQRIFITAGTLYLTGSLLIKLLIHQPAHETRISERKPFDKQAILTIFHHKSFRHLFCLMLCFYLLFAQLFVTLPEYAKLFTPHIQQLFLINGITGIMLQYPVGRLIASFYMPRLYLMAGSCFLFLSFTVLTVWHNAAGLFTAVLLFTFGQILFLPVTETLLSSFAEKSGRMGLYFGLGRMADGLGRPAGSLIGGWLFVSFSPSVVWLVFALIAVSVVLMTSISCFAEDSS